MLMIFFFFFWGGLCFGIFIIFSRIKLSLISCLAPWLTNTKEKHRGSAYNLLQYIFLCNYDFTLYIAFGKTNPLGMKIIRAILMNKGYRVPLYRELRQLMISIPFWGPNKSTSTQLFYSCMARSCVFFMERI